MCGRRWNETSLIAKRSVECPSVSSAGILTTSNWPVSASSSALRQVLAIDGGEEADAAVVDREDRDVGPGVMAQRAQRRAVSAEHDADVGLLLDRRPPHAVGFERPARASPSRPSRTQLDPVLRAARSARDPSAVSSGRWWVNTAARRIVRAVACGHAGSASRAAATRSCSAVARCLGAPDEALPVAGRPGKPRGAIPLHAHAGVHAPPRPPRPAPRGGRRRCARRRPCRRARAPPRTAASRAPAGRSVAPRRRRRAGSTLARPMKDTSTTIRSGSVGKLVGLSAAGVDPLQHGHARILPQAPVELPVGDVHAGHPGRARLQQAVREPAGRGADVQAQAALDLDARSTPARARASARRGRRSGVPPRPPPPRRHAEPSCRAWCAGERSGPDPHLARHHRRGRAAARFEHAHARPAACRVCFFGVMWQKVLRAADCDHVHIRTDVRGLQLIAT